MTAAPLAFPGPQTLARWWPRVAPLHPRGLWFAHLFLQRVEAPVGVRRPHPVDRLGRVVLGALAEEGEGSAAAAARRLHLDPQWVGRILHQLAGAGLAEAGAGRTWRATEAGRSLLADGTAALPALERRTFYFLRGEPAGHPPRFLPLAEGMARPWPAGKDRPFAVADLEACFSQSKEWKARHGFPADLECATGDPGEDWRRVVLVHPERLSVLVVAAAPEGGGGRLTAFPADAETGRLDTARAAFVLEGAAGPDLPSLEAADAGESWVRAWRAWCEAHGIPPAQAEAGSLDKKDGRLQVHAPRVLAERLLRAAARDAPGGEAWLLAGEGAARAAARLEIHAAERASEGPARGGASGR